VAGRAGLNCKHLSHCCPGFEGKPLGVATRQVEASGAALLDRCSRKLYVPVVLAGRACTVSRYVPASGPA